MPYASEDGQKELIHAEQPRGKREPLDGNRIAGHLRAFADQVGQVYPDAASYMWRLANDLQGRDPIVDRSSR